MDFKNQYLTYSEYKELGGNFEELPFNILEFRARKEIDKYTFNRLQELDTQINEVKMCIFELIPVLDQLKTMSENGGITSENIDGYSVSYDTASVDLIQARQKDISNTIRTYLINCKLEDGTPYMYCGVKR